MNIFKGQTENASKVYELRKEIPDKLSCYLDFRPRAGGIKLVSLFDFAPMWGFSKTLKGALAKIKRNQDFLISPNKDDEEKRKMLYSLGFNIRKSGNEDYLEEDVQAFLIRETRQRR